MTHLYWSPKGHFLVSAGLRGMQGELEFWDVDELQLLVCTEHFQGLYLFCSNLITYHVASEVEWDPTGRYLMTGVSFWRYQGENGYVIWDFKGQQLCRKQMDRFKQFLWRPRPPTLLGKEQMKVRP
jgi:translation initiation factor 3 subunit B